MVPLFSWPIPSSVPVMLTALCVGIVCGWDQDQVSDLSSGVRGQGGHNVV